MTTADLPAIDAVQHASFVPELWEDMSLFEGILAHYGRASFVAEKDGVVLGYLITHPTYIERDDFEDGCKDLDGGEDHLYVHDLCVSPDGRGMGIAKLLLERLDVFARENGFLKYCAIAVQDAESFWLKQGFEVVKSYPYNGEPGVLMVRAL